MTEHDYGSDQYNHRLEEYITNVVALKMLVEYTPRELCYCLKVYNLRGRFLHERECVVGLCMEAWEKLKILMTLVSCVYEETRGPFFWELKTQNNGVEKNRLVTHLRDVFRTMTYFCSAAQRFYSENRYPVYSPTIEHINEILMIDSIPMGFYEQIFARGNV